jgi:hypothetical protein
MRKRSTSVPYVTRASACSWSLCRKYQVSLPCPMHEWRPTSFGKLQPRPKSPSCATTPQALRVFWEGSLALRFCTLRAMPSVPRRPARQRLQPARWPPDARAPHAAASATCGARLPQRMRDGEHGRVPARRGHQPRGDDAVCWLQEHNRNHVVRSSLFEVKDGAEHDEQVHERPRRTVHRRAGLPGHLPRRKARLERRSVCARCCGARAARIGSPSKPVGDVRACRGLRWQLDSGGAGSADLRP